MDTHTGCLLSLNAFQIKIIAHIRHSHPARLSMTDYGLPDELPRRFFYLWSQKGCGILIINQVIFSAYMPRA